VRVPSMAFSALMLSTTLMPLEFDSASMPAVAFW
jgi:hypothetical protein